MWHALSSAEQLSGWQCATTACSEDSIAFGERPWKEQPVLGFELRWKGFVFSEIDSRWWSDFGSNCSLVHREVQADGSSPAAWGAQWCLREDQWSDDGQQAGYSATCLPNYILIFPAWHWVIIEYENPQSGAGDKLQKKKSIKKGPTNCRIGWTFFRCDETLKMGKPNLHDVIKP